MTALRRRRKRPQTPAEPGRFEARLDALSTLPDPAPRDGTYDEVRAGLIAEENLARTSTEELRDLITNITWDPQAHRAARALATQAEAAGYARGYRAGLRAARRVADQSREQATRALEGFQNEILRLNDEVTALKAELEKQRQAKERRARSVRKDGVHIPENADEAQRVARNIEEFLKVAQDFEMDLEEIRARLPEEANVRDALHHLLLSRRAVLSGTLLKLAQ